MRFIDKGREPGCLAQHRARRDATYDNLPAECKDELRLALAREQGYLCCYCMQRLHPERDRMKIEHWAAQSNPAGRSLQLAWKNLLGACRGNEGASRHEQHCDTRKGEQPITLDPLQRRCEDLVRYLGDGSIGARDSSIQRELDEVLNLNVAYLQRNRKAKLDAFLNTWARQHAGRWSDAQLGRRLQELQTPGADGRLDEYVGVITWWIRKRIGGLP